MLKICNTLCPPYVTAPYCTCALQIKCLRRCHRFAISSIDTVARYELKKNIRTTISTIHSISVSVHRYLALFQNMTSTIRRRVNFSIALYYFFCRHIYFVHTFALILFLAAKSILYMSTQTHSIHIKYIQKHISWIAHGVNTDKAQTTTKKQYDTGSREVEANGKSNRIIGKAYHTNSLAAY